MAKWHFSPVTGKVEKCRAVIFCKYKNFSEHLNSEEEVEKQIAESIQHPIFGIIENAKRIDLTNEEINTYKSLFSGDLHGCSQIHRLTYKDGRKDSWKNLYKKLPQRIRTPIDIYYNEENSNKINRHLMGEDDVFDVDNEDVFMDAIKSLDTYINTFEKTTNQTYQNLFKGISFSHKDKALTMKMLQLYLDKTEPGAEFEFKGFTSTSASFDEGLNFARSPDEEPRFLYEINTKRGGFLNEIVEEQLLPRNIKLIFIEAKEIIDGITIIRLAEQRS